MRIHIPCAALGIALVAGAPAANADMLVAQETVAVPSRIVVTQPVQTVETIETVRTVRPAARSVVRRRVVTTRQTVVRQRIVPAQIVVGPAPAVAATYPARLYNEVMPAPAPVVTGPLYDEVVDAPAPVVTGPLYDEVVPARAPLGTAVPFYRYVYQPDRILVIDPNTNIVIEAIPR